MKSDSNTVTSFLNSEPERSILPEVAKSKLQMFEKMSEAKLNFVNSMEPVNYRNDDQNKRKRSMRNLSVIQDNRSSSMLSR